MPFEVSKKMLPIPSLDDGIYARHADAVLPRQVNLHDSTTRMFRTNLFNLRCCESRIPLRFSLSQAMPIEGVMRVVFRCSNLEMVRSYARWLVALVPHNESFRHRTIMQFVRKHVSTNLICLLSAKIKGLMVPCIGPTPEPTAISFDDVPPEPFSYRSAAMRIMTSLTAKLASAYSRWRSRNQEFKIAILANGENSGRIAIRHDSKPLFSICVQRLTGVSALVGLAAL